MSQIGKETSNDEKQMEKDTLLPLPLFPGPPQPSARPRTSFVRYPALAAPSASCVAGNRNHGWHSTMKSGRGKNVTAGFSPDSFFFNQNMPHR